MSIKQATLKGHGKRLPVWPCPPSGPHALTSSNAVQTSPTFSVQPLPAALDPHRFGKKMSGTPFLVFKGHNVNRNPKLFLTLQHQRVCPLDLYFFFFFLNSSDVITSRVASPEAALGITASLVLDPDPPMSPANTAAVARQIYKRPS